LCLRKPAKAGFVARSGQCGGGSERRRAAGLPKSELKELGCARRIGAIPRCGDSGPADCALIPPVADPPVDEGRRRLVEWHQSSAAVVYAGRWVLRDPESFDVLDADDSPSDLLERKPSGPGISRQSVP
jgi:hypothetical protein